MEEEISDSSEEEISDIAGAKMKSTGTIEGGDGLWYSPNTATNESGFSGLTGGDRVHRGRFHDVGYYGMWWSSTERTGGPVPAPWSRWLYHTDSRLYRETDRKVAGLSVRCVKD